MAFRVRRLSEALPGLKYRESRLILASDQLKSYRHQDGLSCGPGSIWDWEPIGYDVASLVDVGTSSEKRYSHTSRPSSAISFVTILLYHYRNIDTHETVGNKLVLGYMFIFILVLVIFQFWDCCWKFLEKILSCWDNWIQTTHLIDNPSSVSRLTC